jgi:hypothetical protein
MPTQPQFEKSVGVPRGALRGTDKNSDLLFPIHVKLRPNILQINYPKSVQQTCSESGRMAKAHQKISTSYVGIDEMAV